METSSHRLDALESLRIDYCPSPAEIAQVSALIRQGWSPRERRRRRVGWYGNDGGDDIPQPWYPPVIDTSALVMMGGVKGDGGA